MTQNPAIELLTGWDEDEAHEIAKMIDQKIQSEKKLWKKFTMKHLSMLTR